jgi:hypothetical protein
MHLDGFYRHYAMRLRRHGKPVYIDETGRVGVGQNNNDGIHRRKQYWIWAISGDYCNYHSEGGCYVSLDKEPAEEYWPYLVAFWEDTEWWRMRPSPVPMRWEGSSQAKAYALMAPDSAIFYLCTMQTAVEVGPGEIAVAMRPGQYILRFYVPSTGQYMPPISVQSDGWLRVAVPAFVDDLAFLVAGG